MDILNGMDIIRFLKELSNKNNLTFDRKILIANEANHEIKGRLILNYIKAIGNRKASP